MRPEEIQDLMRLMNQPRIERIVRDERDGKGGAEKERGLEP